MPGISHLDDQGCFTQVNPVYAQTLGYTVEELIGTSWEPTVLPEDRHVAVAAYDQMVKTGKGEFEARGVRKDGSIFHKQVLMVRASRASDKAAGHHCFMREITERKEAEEAIHEANERLSALSGQLLTLQENERRQLARDLHDELGQCLTAVKFNLQRLKSGKSYAVTQGLLQDSMEILDHMVKHVRELSLDLRPFMLDDLGLVDAVRWFVNRQAERAGWKVEMKIDQDLPPLSPDHATASFRIIQEALTNVMRHAQASHVQVEIHVNHENLEILIADNGVGFDSISAMEQSATGHGFGLLSMQERVRVLHGRLWITSQQGKGTQILARLPIKAVAPTEKHP